MSGHTAPWRPGAVGPAADARGVRVVIDVRPLQDPERAPVTAAYLEGLLGALNADPRPGESFSLLLASDLDDPTERFARLQVVGRRLLPPTRLLRSGALTVDPILLRGASLGAGWRAERAGSAGAVYHASAGALPFGSRIPVVAAVLDLAPWELPRAYQRGVAARFGQRLRGRLLRDAAALVVPSRASAAAARRLLRVRADRVRLVPLAAGAAFVPGAGDLPGEEPRSGGAARYERERLGLGGRYAVYAGRFDARQDLPTALAALRILRGEARPPDLAPEADWPPRLCLVGASPADRAALSRAAARQGVGELLAYAPRLPGARLAALVAGARFLLIPARSESAAMPALDAIATGVPVVASAVGALPEAVGQAGLLVEPGDPARLAAALRTAWADDTLHARLVAAAVARAAGPGARTWADVARETREIWADVARPAPLL